MRLPPQLRRTPTSHAARQQWWAAVLLQSPWKGPSVCVVYASHYYYSAASLILLLHHSGAKHKIYQKKHIKKLYTGQDCHTLVCSGTPSNTTDVRKCIWRQWQNRFVFNYIGTALINGTIFYFFIMLCIVPVLLGASHRVGVHYYSQETWTNKQK